MRMGDQYFHDARHLVPNALLSLPLYALLQYYSATIPPASSRLFLDARCSMLDRAVRLEP